MAAARCGVRRAAPAAPGRPGSRARPDPSHLLAPPAHTRARADTVHAAGGVIEGTLCYTGDVSNPKASKYTLEYYLGLAGEPGRLGGWEAGDRARL